MESIVMILLVIVFVAQIAMCILFFLEKQRGNRRNSAMLDYIDRAVDGAYAAFEAELKDANKELLEETGKKVEQFKALIVKDVQESMARQDQSITERINNMAVDYTQAQMAAAKVNDFASSLASIFDYDPLRAIQKGRNKEAS